MNARIRRRTGAAECAIGVGDAARQQGDSSMNRNTVLATFVSTLGATLALVSTAAVAGKPGGGTSGSCTGASAAFVFSKGATNTSKKDLYLANASATCQRYLFSVSNGSYDRYSSFRVVRTAGGSEGRVVTTDGGKDLILARFPIGSTDMQVDPASVTIQRIFDPLQQFGTIDVVSFDLAADGLRLAYVTSNEEGGNTWLSRLRAIPNVLDCLPTATTAACSYNAGKKLAEHVGLSSVFDGPHWSTDGQWIYLNDRRGDFRNPNISRVSSTAEFVAGNEPDVVINGNDNQLSLFGLRLRGTQEVLVYGDRIGSGCRNVRVVTTASCSNGACLTQISSSSSRVLVSRWASLQSIDDASMIILADGGKEDTKGNCSGTGQIVRAVDSSVTGVTVSSLTSGAGPASR
jgi:hypothetical protein